MHKLHKMCGKQHRLIIALAPLMVLCLFILAGCGYSNSDQGSTTTGEWWREHSKTNCDANCSTTPIQLTGMHKDVLTTLCILPIQQRRMSW